MITPTNTSIIVGPAVTKDDYSAGSLLRYDIMMMSKPHPEFVNTARESHELVAEVLSTNVSSQKDLTKRVRQLRLQALTPLTPTGQASGTSMGFFDQGILTGIVAFVLPTLCLASVGAFYAGRSAYRYFIWGNDLFCVYKMLVRELLFTFLWMGEIE